MISIKDIFGYVTGISTPAPETQRGCHPGMHVWRASVDLDQLDQRFRLLLAAGRIAPGVEFTCTECGASQRTPPAELRPRVNE